MTAGEWELAGPEAGGSRLYPRLDQYQRDGYQALLKIARKYRGAFLCDGVGLGKTFVGMMVLERLVVHERKRVALLVPKAAREAVWETSLKRYLPNVSRRDFSNLVIFNHTDLQREGEFKERLDYIKQVADAIIIDEAHHFRNPGIKGTGERRPSRYRRLFEIADGKEMYLLTATPVNNRLIDLQHMIELFSRQQTDYFKDAPLGIHSLGGQFRRMEKELERTILGHEVGSEAGTGIETNESEAREVLLSDPLVQALVVQRSRAYVRKSQEQHGHTRRKIGRAPSNANGLAAASARPQTRASLGMRKIALMFLKLTDWSKRGNACCLGGGVRLRLSDFVALAMGRLRKCGA
jgi:hypothetical protein